jgi:CBS domain-containing protein
MEQILVSEIMSAPTTIQQDISVTPDTTLTEAARLMRKHKINQVPVVSAEGKIVGTVTESDIARVMIEMVPRTMQREFMPAQIPSGLALK